MRKGQCPVCGREFVGRTDKIFCSSTCKGRPRAPSGPNKCSVEPVSDHPLVVAVKAELASAGRLDSALGAAAIGLASAMCAPRVGNAAFVAASKELSRTMKAALKGAPPVSVGSKRTIAHPVVDELTTRRSKRIKRGYTRRP
jgi:hypothetical protein